MKVSHEQDCEHNSEKIIGPGLTKDHQIYKLEPINFLGSAISFFKVRISIEIELADEIPGKPSGLGFPNSHIRRFRTICITYHLFGVITSFF